MTTQQQTRTEKPMTTVHTGPRTTPARQLRALVWMELLLLRRNWTATLAALFLMFMGIMHADDWKVGAPTATGIGGLVGLIGAFVVHHHLTTVYSSRRQEFVLKRLRTGSPSDLTILVGTASSPVLIFLLQVFVLMGYAMAKVGMPFPVNPVVILVALLLAAGVLAAMSALVSAFTRSSEAALLTTLPTMALLLATPGVLVPYGTMPPAVEQVMWFSPFGSFIDAFRSGWVGDSFFGAIPGALPGIGMMALWLVGLAFLVRKYFRWEPREGR